jgi:hypothetical protein
MIWSMINIDLFYHFTNCWEPYMCFLTHFYLLHQNDKWGPLCQLLGTTKRKTEVGITATAFLWVDHMAYDQYRPALPIDILLLTIHVLLDLVFILYITKNDKWLCQCQLEASKRKTVVGISATSKLWIQGMDYDQHRPATPFKNLLAFIHVVLQSL